MMIVAFWSPVVGKAGTTNNIFTTSARMALTQNKKVLLINSQYKSKDIETAIVPPNTSELLESVGIDCLLRNAKMRKISENSIRVSSLAYYGERLHIITGSTKKNEELFETEMFDLFPMIVRGASQYYDVVMVDVASGTSKMSRMILDVSDTVVVNLPQNKYLIEACLKKCNELNKKIVYLIGNYDNKSIYNRKNLERIFKQLKHKTVVIPHDVNLKDSFSDGIIKFLQKDVESKKYLFEEVEKVGCLILKGDKTSG